MSTGLPVLQRNERMNLAWEGTAYELENGNVFIVALVHGMDEVENGAKKARADAVSRAFSLLPPGYGQPEPMGEWVDLIVHGIFGYGRKYIAKKKESPVSMSNRDIRKQMRKLGGKPTVGLVERAAASINTSAAEKRFRVEQAKELGIHNVPIDPRTVSDPKRWYEGKPVQTDSPEIARMKAERARAKGDRFRDR